MAYRACLLTRPIHSGGEWYILIMETSSNGQRDYSTRRGVTLPRPPTERCTLSLTFAIVLRCVRDAAPFLANTTSPWGVSNSIVNAPSRPSTVARKDEKSLLRRRWIMKSCFDFVTFSANLFHDWHKNRPPWWSNVWFIYAHVIQLDLF